ncbi:MAG: Zn-ribbon domain-containing OB-fold protein, partial [Alphaproteobacteria bacterium]
MTPVPLGSKGYVRTFSIVRAAPSRFEQPYVIAYVALDDTDIQVFAPVKGIEFDKVYIGMPVRVSIE